MLILMPTSRISGRNLSVAVSGSTVFYCSDWVSRIKLDFKILQCLIQSSLSKHSVLYLYLIRIELYSHIIFKSVSISYNDQL